MRVRVHVCVYRVCMCVYVCVRVCVHVCVSMYVCIHLPICLIATFMFACHNSGLGNRVLERI